MCFYSRAQKPGEPQNYLTQSPTCFSGYCISSQLSEHIISPKGSRVRVCLLTAREFVNILDERCSVRALLGWKGPDPEEQDAASTADLAEGARPEPSHPLGTPVPSPGQRAPYREIPGTLSEGALYTCTLLPTAHTVPVLLCAALQAALGSQPGGRVPPQWWEKCFRNAVLAGTYPHALSCYVSAQEDFLPLQNLTALWSSSPCKNPYTLHCGKARLLQ